MRNKRVIISKNQAGAFPWNSQQTNQLRKINLNWLGKETNQLSINLAGDKTTPTI